MAIIGLFLLRFILLNIIWYGTIFTTAYNDILPNQSKKMSMVAKPFYYPTIMLINVENNGYSDQYIQSESTRGTKYLDGYHINPAIKTKN